MTEKVAGTTTSSEYTPYDNSVDHFLHIHNSILTPALVGGNS